MMRSTETSKKALQPAVMDSDTDTMENSAPSFTGAKTPNSTAASKSRHPEVWLTKEQLDKRQQEAAENPQPRTETQATRGDQAENFSTSTPMGTPDTSLSAPTQDHESRGNKQDGASATPPLLIMVPENPSAGDIDWCLESL